MIDKNTDWETAEEKKAAGVDDGQGQVNGNWHKMTEQGYRRQHRQQISVLSVIRYQRETGQLRIRMVARLNEEGVRKIGVEKEDLRHPTNYQT